MEVTWRAGDYRVPKPLEGLIGSRVPLRGSIRAPLERDL